MCVTANYRGITGCPSNTINEQLLKSIIVEGGILGGITHYVQGGVSAARASLSAVEKVLNNTPNIYKGGTILAQRLAAQMSYQAAQKVLWAAQYNASMIIATTKTIGMAAKFGLNYLFKRLWS